MSVKTGFYDKYDVPILQGDYVEVPGSEGPIKTQAIHLQEEGFMGWYLEKVSKGGKLTRTMRIALKYMNSGDMEIVS